MQNEQYRLSGRKRSPIWQLFDRVVRGTAERAICRNCKKEMQAVLSKISKHVETCQPAQINNSSLEDSVAVTQDRSAAATNTGLLSQHKKFKTNSSNQINLTNFTVKTSKTDKVTLDQEIANYIYATNTPFQAVEHDQFIKIIRLLNPGYIPPNRHQVRGDLLDQSFSSVMEAYSEELKGKTVCMAMDGWSNIHNEPILALTLLKDGNMYIIDCIDTAESRHTADYLVKVVECNAEKVKKRFGCTVRSFVTDSAANIAKMRKELGKDEEIITYGCSAHLLNLFLQDMQISNIKENITEIIKYFKNHHIPGSLYKAAGGTMLVLPVETRWNTIADSVESYLKNWEILVKVCKDNSEEVDEEIIKKVNNKILKRKTEDYLERMKPITVALDHVQRETTLISDAVEIWLKLKDDMKEYLTDKTDMDNFEKRISVALTPAHFLANMIDPRYEGRRLTPEQRYVAKKYVCECFPEFLPTLMSFVGKSKPFDDFYFGKGVLETLSPLAWWDFFSNDFKVNVMNVPRQLFTAVSSSAGVERVFSTFGYVHSTMINCLGKEEASKLVTIHKYYNR